MENVQQPTSETKSTKFFRRLFTLRFVFTYGLLIVLAISAGFYFGNLLGFKAGQNKGIEIGKEAGKRELLDRRETKSHTFTALWGLINNYRKYHKLPEIKINDPLCQLSDLRSKQIVSDWSHNYFWNNTDLLFNKYCNTCVGMGENLARDFLDAESLFDAWLDSPIHKDILDRPYTIGCLSINEFNSIYYVALELAR